MDGSGKIGILTGGGDVPGLNSVIKSVVYRASEMGRSVIGIRRGWEGLTHLDPSQEIDARYIRLLTRENTRAIDRSGGTVLHTSRTNPMRIRSEQPRQPISRSRNSRRCQVTGRLLISRRSYSGISRDSASAAWS